MRSHAPDAAGPALRADGATFETRPRPGAPPPCAPGRGRVRRPVRGRLPRRARGARVQHLWLPVSKILKLCP
ncbi:hypothetical protein B9S64_12710 [Streptomyces sp. SM18]|nr:hypothetical protein B9S64_12710 [Streptomyces sp. SM18]